MITEDPLQNLIAELKNSKSSFRRNLGQSLESRSRHGVEIEVTKHGNMYEYASITGQQYLERDVVNLQKLGKIKVDTPSQQEILKRYKKWTYPSLGIYVHGNMGSGKTTMMDAMQHDLKLKRSDLTIKCFDYTSLSRGLSDYKTKQKLSCKNIASTREVTSHEFYDYHCKNSNVLFLDDFLRVDHPFHPVDNLLDILNHRIKFNCPTFFTSNLSINGVSKVSSAISERLLELTLSMECVTNESYRLKKQREYQVNCN